MRISIKNRGAAHGSDPNRLLFAGEYFDPTHTLSYNRARWMEPATGRFLSLDPWSGNLSVPSTLNRYTYAGNEPISSRDPSGLFELTGSQLTAIAIIGLTASLAIPTFQASQNRSYDASFDLNFNIDIASLMADMSGLPQAILATAAGSLTQFFDRVRDEYRRAVRRNGFSSFCLVIQTPTPPPPIRTTPLFFPTACGPDSPSVITEEGGFPGHITGAYLMPRSGATNQRIWLGRLDYHMLPYEFPGYPFTLHYHVPPDMSIHYALWPSARVGQSAGEEP